MQHIRIAASEEAFKELFNRIRDDFSWSNSNSVDLGPFTAGYGVGVKLEGGSINLQNTPDRVVLNELDVVIDPLFLQIGIDLPTICTPSICLFWLPIVGCVLEIPSYCLFEDDIDFGLDLDLGNIIEAEISGAFNVVTNYYNNPAKAGQSDHQAYFSDSANRWQFLLDPIWLDLDIIDIADVVGNILDAAIDAAIDNFLGGAPGFVVDLIEWLFGGIVDLIVGALDIFDDIDEWLSDLLGVSLGLFDTILTVIAEFLAADNPIYEFQDPYPMLSSGSLIPVLLPIENVDVDITNDEFLVLADIGN
ncbi:MAG: hypothetical protein KTR30_10815 [Saprospiraceae bacterium]|nr:hypothetical protein [Saprospiraceae bacterium]